MIPADEFYELKTLDAGGRAYRRVLRSAGHKSLYQWPNGWWYDNVKGNKEPAKGKTKVGLGYRNEVVAELVRVGLMRYSNSAQTIVENHPLKKAVIADILAVEK